MALSFCSNWATTAPDYLNPPDTAPFHDQQSDPLLGFDDPFDPSHFLIDSLFDPLNDDPFYAEPSDPLFLSLPPDELGLYPCPKRPKCCPDLCHPPDVFVGPSESDSWVRPPPPGVGIFPGCGGGNKASSGCPSAQSVAARERRKRISQKTQELGRLIPGGGKMNTAEMLHAAFNYVKFLQAQVGVLGLLGSTQGCRASPEVEEHIQLLLASPTVQEKLYADGRCMIPKRVVEALAEDQKIKSNRLIYRDLDRFVKSMG